MSLLVVGSIAFDTVETQKEKRENLLGGSATYFAIAASLYTDVHLVGVVGEDFPQESLDLFKEKKIDIGGLQIKEGETFRWWGKYTEDMNHRETIEVDLNVFEEFDPHLPEEYRDIPYIFLGNGSPQLQAKVLDQMEVDPQFVAIDTMDLWIQTQRPALLKVLQRVNAIILNDDEARLLTEESNMVRAGRMILDHGPEVVIIKKGEHGAIMVSGKGIFTTPAYPLEYFSDPTGAGDCFAGGFMGYLSETKDRSFNNLKKAVIHGTIAASFNVEDFGVNRLLDLDREQLRERLRDFIQLAYAPVEGITLPEYPQEMKKV